MHPSKYSMPFYNLLEAFCRLLRVFCFCFLFFAFFFFPAFEDTGHQLRLVAISDYYVAAGRTFTSK